MQFAAPDRDALDRLLRWRRDMRHFRPDPVPPPLLEELRAAMEMAPSVGNSRPWRVIRIESPGLRAEIRADFLRCNADAAATYQGRQRQQYDALKLAGLDRAPVWLAVFTDLDPPEGHGLGRAVLVGIAGDDLVVGRGFTQAGQHRLDLFLMSHKNGRGNTLPAGLDHSLDNRLVVGRRHGDNAGLSAFGRRDDAVDRVYHIRSSCTISFAV